MVTPTFAAIAVVDMRDVIAAAKRIFFIVFLP